MSRDAAAGLLMEAELEHLGRCSTRPERPFVGDSRRRQGVRQDRGDPESAPRLDALVIGGAMAYTFFLRPRRPGRQVARRAGPGRRRRATSRHRRARAVDAGAADRPRGDDEDRGGRTAETMEVGDAARSAIGIGVDIGPKTIARYAEVIRRREDGRLERPDGRVRDRRVREGHDRRGEGRCRRARGRPSSAGATRSRRSRRRAWRTG